MGQISAVLALVTGLTLAIAETWLNWGDWQPWPYFVVDYLPAAMLVLGGLRTLRKQKGGLRLLAGGWANSYASHTAFHSKNSEGRTR